LTPDELRQGRLALGLTVVQFADIFDVNERTLRSWEKGEARGPIPKPIALLVRLALRHAHVRRELGIPPKAQRSGTN
jgi:DNA-binding transcriptional regulator YiaG